MSALQFPHDDVDDRSDLERHVYELEKEVVELRERSSLVSAPLVLPSGMMVLSGPIVCAGCKRSVYVVSNRAGVTRCVPCDDLQLYLQSSAPF